MGTSGPDPAMLDLAAVQRPAAVGPERQRQIDRLRQLPAAEMLKEVNHGDRFAVVTARGTDGAAVWLSECGRTVAEALLHAETSDYYPIIGVVRLQAVNYASIETVKVALRGPGIIL
jgi:hypothetical protein